MICFTASVHTHSHTDEASGGASSGVLLASSVSSVVLFSLQICTIFTSLPLSVTATGTVGAGVNSSCDGMSENPMSLPGHVPLQALLGCLDAQIPFHKEPPGAHSQRRGLCVSTRCSQLAHRYMQAGFLEMVWNLYSSLGQTH